MKIVALALCTLIFAMGALGVFQPRQLLEAVRRFQSAQGLWIGAGIRVLLGVALYVSAPETRAPDVLRSFGVFVFVAGIVTPFIGVERFGRMLDWWMSRGDGFVRAWSAFAMTLGAMLVWLIAGPV